MRTLRPLRQFFQNREFPGIFGNRSSSGHSLVKEQPGETAPSVFPSLTVALRAGALWRATCFAKSSFSLRNRRKISLIASVFFLARAAHRRARCAARIANQYNREGAKSAKEDAKKCIRCIPSCLPSRLLRL